MSSRRSPRSRAFVFTKNNSHDATWLESVSCRYLCYGKELAPTTLTPHLQGYIYFRNAKSCAAVRAILGGCHIEPAKGTYAQNKEYCSKGGDFFERGDPPQDNSDRGDAEVARWEETWALAKTGDVEAIPADIRIRCYTTIRKIERDYMKDVAPLGDVCGLWVYGLSGSGKTRAVLSQHPKCFPKPRTQWWDGYQMEDVVLVDDVDKFDVKLGGQLKHWADFCPFIAQNKGSSFKIRPKLLIVTSQYKIEEIWEDAETREALNRRFKFLEKKKDEEIVISLDSSIEIEVQELSGSDF